jgi:XTP/dITP diphosphohydrolase
MRKLLIATGNKGKFPEIVAILKGLPLECINLRDVTKLPQDFDVEEPATTFEGNAIIKAMTVGSLSGELTVAEDAGLEVDAIDGRPGVYTARYAPGTDDDRNNKLLSELDSVPASDRTARFKAVVAIYDPQTQKVRLCEGTYEGFITTEKRGTNGFGYDPIFFSRKLQKTSAEMSQDEKNQVSHRGKAFRQAKIILEQEFDLD